MRKNKLLSWVLSLVMALTVFSIPVGVFAKNDPIDWENEGTEFYVTDAKDTGFLYVFNGKKQLPDAVVEWGDELLTEGVDYDILPANEESQNSVNAGDYKFDVYVKGKFKPGVVRTIDLTINTKDLRPTVTLTKNSYVYDGKVKTPAVTVKDGSTILKEGTDLA